MAKSQVNKEQFVVSKPVIVFKKTGVTLELTAAEAIMLQSLFRKIGGSPSDSARGFVDNIIRALSHNGVPYCEGIVEEVNGSIYMRDGSVIDINERAEKWELE